MRAAIVLLLVLALVAVGAAAYFYFSQEEANPMGGPLSDVVDFFTGNREPVGFQGGNDPASPLEDSFPATTTYRTAQGADVQLISQNEPLEMYLAAHASSSVSGGSIDCVDSCTLTIAKATESDGAMRFDIFYRIDSDLFVIVLETEPIAAVRKEAEDALVSSLKVERTALCSTRHFVDVPPYVNGFYAGKNIGFSFCPGSIAL